MTEAWGSKYTKLYNKTIVFMAFSELLLTAYDVIDASKANRSHSSVDALQVA